MTKKILLFAPAVLDLAETTRMIEIAKAIRHHAAASNFFDFQFIWSGSSSPPGMTAVWLFINLWIWYSFLNPLNKVARHFGIESYKSMFDYWRWDITLVAEPAEFTGVKLPPNYYFDWPLIVKQNFPLPEEIKNLPYDQPLI